MVKPGDDGSTPRLVPVPYAERVAIHARLSDRVGTNGWSQLVHWFYSVPEQRAISPLYQGAY